MSQHAANSPAVRQLIADLQSSDDAIRGAAWQGAAAFGAPAVKPVAELMSHPDFEVARSAKRALWKIARHAGRPRAAKERKAVQAELISVLETTPVPARRELAWMLSEIGDTRAVKPLAALLMMADVREDARCALERIPGHAATRALKRALRTASENFRLALAHSLHVRSRKGERHW